MTIRAKLFLGVAVCTMLLTTLVGVAIWRQLALAEVSARTEAENVATVIALAASDQAGLDGSALIRHPARLQKFVDALHQTEHRDLVIVDHEKRILADIDHTDVGQVFDHDRGAEVRHTIRDGRPREFVERSDDHLEILAFAKDATVFVAAVGLLCLVIVAALGYRMSRGLSSRIEHLKDAMRQFAQGGTDIRAKLPGGDELGDLGSAFDRMADDLTTSQRMLMAAREDAEQLARENARLYAQTKEQLTQAQTMEVVGQLAGGVAHDFNNLLTVIIGCTAFLRNGIGVDPSLGRHVDVIEQTATRAAGLTRQLLAFSRKQILQPKVLDLNAVVGTVSSMLRRLIGEDIDFVVAAGAGIAAVEADPGQLEQVLMNLVVNARDGMPGGGSVRIATQDIRLDTTYATDHAQVPPGRYVLLTISDTGTGMDAATQARIFEPFFTTKGPGKGTGLGLAAVYGIVMQSGGHVDVWSELGHGTIFKIYLPAVDAPVETKIVHAPRQAPRGSDTVLVVEDELELRNLVGEVLESSGYTVLQARDGTDALRMCAVYDGDIHLLLTDVIMPQMSGPELADRAQALRPTMKILYMSGYTDGVIDRHGVLDTGVALLEKPFTPAMVIERIQELLDPMRHRVPALVAS